MTAPAPVGDWDDEIRARDWDLPEDTDLQTLLGLIGAGNSPHYAQAEALRDFMRQPGWKPAPDKLKLEAGRFLGRGGAL